MSSNPSNTIVLNHRSKGIAKKSKQIQKLPKPETAVQQYRREVQEASEFCIPRRSFQRVVREIAEETLPFYAENSYRFTKEAMEALQFSAEDYLIGLFQDANACAHHGNRVTLQHKDMELALRLRKDPNDIKL